MDSTKSPLLHQEYVSRINLVQDYIERNINNVFTLEELSAISGFSKYHFHRIFGSIMNETLYNYINRQKLEKAASFLLHAPHKTITEIALDLCFANSAMFARSFKKYYGMSATEYRLTYSKKSQMNSKIRKVNNAPPRYNEIDKTNDWRQKKMKLECKVDIVDVEELTVIYLRHVGPYSEFGKVFQSMLGRLLTWASAKGIVNDKGIKLLTIYHDNHEITNEDKLRTSVCMAVPKDTIVDGELGKMAIPAGKYAIGHFAIDNGEQHGDAWKYLYGEWLPNSGYQPDDGASFEMYLNDPNTHPEKKHFIDIYLPVKPL
ncbi:AraC family transcriptional regulator [Chengkuizengella sp. SCS-71B]|uniref:AraC family transcriptional regulator n=1 Tax=Chengkuizengella sp. SCS-71B TaxID=3115290 RepID=UPI0032C24095